MTEPTISRSYAETLLALGERTGQLNAFAEAADRVAGLLNQNPQVRRFLMTPRIETSDKKDALRKALGGNVPKPFLNYLFVVLDKRRQRLLPQILREYRLLLDEHLGILHAEVTLAREPDERLEEEIATGLGRMLGKRVVPHIHVDPAILGGIVVRYGDRIIDGSLRRRLLALRRRMLEPGRSAAGR